jgi:hypothetical protein
MATTVYDSEIIILIDGTEVRMTPLKIKYLRKFMEAFEKVKSTENDTDAMYRLSLCAAIAMEQYNPKFASIESIEDSCDIQTIYKIVEIAAGIKMKEDSEESVKDQATEKGSTWDKLDLAKLESEAFLLGIWKDYEELESSLSMPELTSTLEQKRENDYNDKKFLAAIQGVDLDKNSGKQDEWEQMKARVFSGGKTSDANDISTFKGAKASKAGFGLGMGLGYQDLTKKKA